MRKVTKKPKKLKKPKTKYVSVPIELPGHVLDYLKRVADSAGTDIETVASVIVAMQLLKAPEAQKTPEAKS